MGKFHISCIFTGNGKEWAQAGLVDSNAKESNEVQIVIDRPVSLTTLKDIVTWAEEKQKQGYKLT